MTGSALGRKDLGCCAFVYGAAGVALALARAGPSFSFLGPRGELFGFLAYSTALAVGLPGLAARLCAQSPPRSLGLGWGRSRRDAPAIGLCLALAVLAAWVISRSPELRAYYPQYRFVRDKPILWIPSTLAFAGYGLSWEVLFRGHLVLGAPKKLAAHALFAQTAVYALAHIGKPPMEVALSVPAGLFFGALALRTGSILPGYFIHITLSTAINLFCVYG